METLTVKTAMHSLELKIPPVVLTALFAFLMWALSNISLATTFSMPGKNWLVALFCLLGAIIAILGVLAFRQAQTTVDPRFPDKTTSMVKSGIYQLSRNPMYLGILFLLTGWAIYLSNGLAFLPLLIFILYMHRFQSDPEERAMQKKFGDEYISYTAEVRRWI